MNAVEPEFGGTPLGWAIYGWGEGTRGGDHYDTVAQLVRAGATVKQEWIDDDTDRTEFAKRTRSDPRMMAALRGETP